MIMQKPTKTITGAYTTTDADNGHRIICNSSSNFTITLHSASGRNNFELEIDNIGAGSVTINSRVLKQYTHAHVGNNGGNDWAVVVGGGSMTKAEIEAVLIGEITSHSHPFNDNVLKGTVAPSTSTVGTIGQFYLETTTPKTYQCTAINDDVYTWTEVGGGGSFTLPQANATTLGGIKAKAKTTESSEVAIDATTGKLFAPAPDEAANGLPAGGSIGQIPVKLSGNNYDVGWGDMVGGGVSEDTSHKKIIFCCLEDLAITQSFAMVSMNYPAKISSVKLELENAPLGSDVIIDINKNGTTIYTTQLNRPTIAEGNTTNNNLVLPDIIDIGAGDEISVDIDQIGSSFAGSKLTLTIGIRLDVPQPDDYTELLLHCDGENGSAVFVDSAGNYLVTPVDTVISTAQNKFGGASALLTGTPYIYFNQNVSIDNKKFAIDLWYYPTVINPTYNSLISFGGSSGAFGAGVDSAGKAYLYASGFRINGATAVQVNTWNHFALVGDGASVKIFLNGVLQGTWTTSYNFGTRSLRFGSNESSLSEKMTGHLDEIRVSIGIARWTQDFVPQNMPYIVGINSKFAQII